VVLAILDESWFQAIKIAYDFHPGLLRDFCKPIIYREVRMSLQRYIIKK